MNIDTQTIIKAQQGDKKALKDVVEAYYRIVLIYFKYLCKNTAQAEDLTHDTVLKMIENIDKVKVISERKFKAWVMIMGRNIFYDRLRKEKPQSSLSENIAQDMTDPQLIIVKNENVKRLQNAIDKLSEEDKQLIILQYYAQLSQKEIGAVMNLSAKKVKWKIHYARQKLKEYMRSNTDEI